MPKTSHFGTPTGGPRRLRAYSRRKRERGSSWARPVRLLSDPEISKVPRGEDAKGRELRVNAAWDFFLAGFTYFRIRVTAFTSGLAQFQVARYTNAQDPTPSVVAQGAAATGTAATGNPVLVAGSDGANARNLSTDATGRAVVAGGAAVGAAVAGNPVFVAGADGASTGYARQPTVTPPNTPVNGQTTNQPTVLLIGGVDGIYTVSPSQAAPNLNPVGTARAILTDNAGVLQVSDSSISLLRQELRETNALLLMILQTLAGNDMVTGKDGLMPHQVPVQ